MDAGAIIQNDARVDCIQALTEFTREYGQYNVKELRNGKPPFENWSYPGVFLPWDEEEKNSSDYRR